MKRKIILSAIIVLLVCLPVYAGIITYKLYPVSYPVYVDGTQLQGKLPVMTYKANGGDNTYVPLKAVLNMMGATTTWNGKAVNITANQLNFNDIKKLTDKCVMIKVYNKDKYVGQGSGVILGDTIITCSHVLTPGNIYKVCYNNTTDLLKNKNEYESKKIKEDVDLDIAIIENPQKQYTGIKIGDSSSLEYGNPAIVIGSPKGTKNVVSFGIITGFATHILSFNGDVNNGNSGGALINARDGTLIGIVNQINNGTTNQLRDSNAIPISDIKSLIK